MSQESWAMMVEKFNTVNGYPSPPFGTITHPSKKCQVLRLRLMMEELGELAKAMHEENLLEVADGLCDLLYVTVGTAVEYGLGPLLNQLFTEVHRSNMTKFQGEVITSGTVGDDLPGLVSDKYSGKVRKDGQYDPPHLREIIDDYRNALKYK